MEISYILIDFFHKKFAVWSSCFYHFLLIYNAPYFGSPSPADVGAGGAERCHDGCGNAKTVAEQKTVAE